MAKKDKRATDQLNVALAGIDSGLTVAMTFIGEDHQAHRVLKAALEHCEAARDALITIQFHAAQI